MSDDSLDQGSSSSYGDSASQPHLGKGKGRQDSLAQSYRFPEKGMNGGPPDPFEVMALDRSATQQEVKQQYYKLALLLHPDSSHPSSSPDHFATLNKAYNLLSKQSSRSAFLKTGYGWDVSTSSGGNQTWSDSLMRAEIARRRNGGAAAWNGASRRYRDSDAGRGAWGGFDGSQGWRPYEDPSKGFSPPTSGPAEERYMSNPRFLAVVGVASAVIAWVHWHRLGYAAETHRDMLDKQNIDASRALAQARYEAATHGHIRREQIRRRVREAEVLKELEKADQGHIAVAGPPTAYPPSHRE
ncbi:hypothetical protein LQV05_003759 [Cryptococcus neoformans]|nr:hypothetical protein LQV05_003759 [Cryptococcus neoformans]